MELRNTERALNVIKNASGECHLRADGSIPATMRRPEQGWDDEGLIQYLKQEVRMSLFQDVIRAKGYGSIFLVTPYAGVVLHIRVIQDLDGYTFYYMD